MELREATQEDLDYMSNHSVSRGIQKKMPERVDYVYALEHEGVPLMIGGFGLINKHTAWCWVDLSDTAGGHIHTAYRVIKEWIDKFIEEHKLTRIQSYVECDFPEAIRTVEHLGFTKESIMKNFMGDKDAYLYIRIA